MADSFTKKVIQLINGGHPHLELPVNPQMYIYRSNSYYFNHVWIARNVPIGFKYISKFKHHLSPLNCVHFPIYVIFMECWRPMTELACPQICWECLRLLKYINVNNGKSSANIKKTNWKRAKKIPAKTGFNPVKSGS